MCVMWVVDADVLVGIRCVIRMGEGIIRCRVAGIVWLMGIRRLGMGSPRGDAKITVMRFEVIFDDPGYASLTRGVFASRNRSRHNSMKGTHARDKTPAYIQGPRHRRGPSTITEKKSKE